MKIQLLISKAWKDPVLSKIISALILMLGSLFFDFARNFLWYYWHYPVIILLVSIVFWQQSTLNQPPLLQLETDKQTYKKAQYLLNNHKLMDRIRIENYSSSFNNDIFELFDELNFEVTKNPIDYEFIDKDLNHLFLVIMFSLNEFGDYLAENTWPRETNGNFSGIPLEWEDTQPERSNEVVRNLRNLKNNLLNSYDEFSRQGKIKFSSI